MTTLKFISRVGKVFLPILFILCLAGCGTNIFKGLSDEQLPKDTTKLIETGHYEEAIQAADAIIESSETTVEEKQKAYADKGLAILGKNNVSLGVIASTVGDYTTASDFLNGGLAKLTSQLLISNNDAIESADMLNAAFELSQSGTVTPSIRIMSSLPALLAPSLNKTAQFNRAFANATVVVKMGTRYLDITEEGVTLNSTAKAGDLTITDVFLYLNSGVRNVYYYSINAYDAAIKSNALTQSQLNAVKNALEANYNMHKLYKAYENNTAFTMVDIQDQNLNVYTSATFSGVTGEARETLLKEALRAIYNHYK